MADSKALRLAYNIIRREGKFKTTLPDGSRLPKAMIDEAVAEDMVEKYGSMYYEYVPSKVGMQKEGRQRGTSQRTEKGKQKVSEDTVQFLKEQYNKKKELLALPSYDEFKTLSKDEQAEAFLALNRYKEYEDRTIPSARKFKADMEVARSRILNSSKVPLEIRRYLSKADLQTVKEYLEFMEEARKRVGNAVDAYYQEMMEDYYETKDMAASANTPDRKILFNFLRYQISKSDGDRTNKIIRKASQIKVRGKQVFTYDELEGYL